MFLNEPTADNISVVDICFINENDKTSVFDYFLFNVHKLFYVTI